MALATPLSYQSAFLTAILVFSFPVYSRYSLPMQADRVEGRKSQVRRQNRIKKRVPLPIDFFMFLELIRRFPVLFSCPPPSHADYL